MKRLMLVEDDAVHLESLEHYLRASGFDICAAGSAEAALQRVSAFDPHLVLTDVRMPGLSGLDLVARLHRDRRETPVIVMTAYGDMQTAVEAMKAGAYDYLIKPLDIQHMDEVLRYCLEQCDEENETRVDCVSAGAPGELVGCDPRMVEIYKTVGSVAGTRTPVLIRGDTGTGKELIARALHCHGPSPAAPFLPVDCTAVPEPLLESELFGHVRGAFTGAIADRKGRFEMAGTGTIFLDEIGDTAPAFQAKLLRVLQEREFFPLGSERPRRSEARVVAATHRPIEELVRVGAFREDLYFRLRVVEIFVPRLRERRGDIPVLVRHILSRLSREMGRQFAVPDDVMGELLAHDWPGNVRELENALTRAAVFSRSGLLSRDHLVLGTEAPVSGVDSETAESLDAIERAHVQRVLTDQGGNKSRAAERLRISRPRLDRMISKHRLVV